MNIMYGTVTSVFTSDSNGAQLVNVKSHISDKEYTNCEVLSLKGMNSLPNDGDLVAFVQIHNSDILVLGVVEPYDLDISSKEVLIHSGEVTQQGQAKTYAKTASILLKPDGSIEIVSEGTVTITAPSVEII